MNPVIETINKRRSIRAYESKPIPRDVINTIIEAGNQAPSTMGMMNGVLRFQPWRFVVIENPEFKQKLFQTAFPIWKKMTGSMKEMDPEVYEKVTKLYETMPEPKDMVYHGAPVIIFVSITRSVLIFSPGDCRIIVGLIKRARQNRSLRNPAQAPQRPPRLTVYAPPPGHGRRSPASIG